MTLIEILGSIIVAIAIAMSIIVNIYLSLRYQRKQTKVDAARLALDMQKRFMEQDFRETVKFLKTGVEPSEWDKDKEIRKMMNYFEYMGMFEKDGVLEWKYIESIHGHVLKMLKTDFDSKRLLDKWVKKDPKFYFVYIKNMFDKIEID